MRKRLFGRRRRSPAPGGTRFTVSTTGAGIVLLAAFSVACVTAAAARPSQPAVEQLRWLLGCWSMTTPNGLVISEMWTQPARDTLAGVGLTKRGGSVVASETLRIFDRSDTLVYAALPSGQAYTEFRATSVGEQGIVFENPEHDFPQSVMYMSGPGPDSLRAHIHGVTQGQPRTVAFAMARTPCPAP